VTDRPAGCRTGTAPSLRTRELVIDGLPLADDSVGVGVYGRRLVRSLLARREDLTCTPIVAAPAWLAPRLDAGAPSAARDREPARRQPPFTFVRSPRSGHPLIDAAIWSQRVGLWARRRGAMFFSPAPFWAAVAPEACVVVQHDRIPHYFPAYLGRKLVRKFLARRSDAFLRRCRAIVVHSEHGRRDVAGIPGLAADRIRVIRPWLPDEFNPPDAARLAPGVRETYRLPPRFWLYVGGYDYRKNVELLIAAYARVAREPEAPRLVLAGPMPPTRGPYCDVEGALARAELPAGAVVRPGFIAAEDMPGLFGAAELMIYPSRYEGFGLPPMEAMGCGCPAICADTSSLPEVVRDADYRFADHDAASLGALLERAAQRRLPPNPSFTRNDFREKMSLDAYVALFNDMTAS